MNRPLLFGSGADEDSRKDVIPMLVNQISVFIEDKLGRLAQITEGLGEHDINILGFSINDSAEGYGIFHLIASDPEKALDTLRRRGFSTSVREVVCAQVPNRPGGLAEVLKILSSAGLNVQYLYSIVSDLIVFNLDDNHEGAKVLRDAGIRVLNENEITLL